MNYRNVEKQPGARYNKTMSITNERASKKQQELLAFVDGFIKGNGYGPSYREIMRALGYKSVSTVAIHIDGLIAKGYLRRRDNSARSLEVVTLREPVAHSVAEERKPFNDELLAAIVAVELSEDQRQQVITTLELLKLKQVADKLQDPAEDS